MLKSVASLLSTIPIPATSTYGITRVSVPMNPYQPKRYAMGTGYGGTGFIDSKLEGPKEMYTEVEKSYAEWKFVEKLLPKKYIPDPPNDPNKVYPSGWKPQNPRSYLQYFIPRSKNHMVPVYLSINKSSRGTQRVTKIKHVEGNIWLLEKDIGFHLKQKYPEKTILTWVNESYRVVFIQGDHDDEVRDWVLQQGF